MQNRERVAWRSNAIIIARVTFLLAYASMMFFTGPARAQTADSDHPILTAAEFKKLIYYDKKTGHDLPFAPDVTQLVGLSSPGETVTVRQINASDTNDTVHFHYFNLDKINPDIIIFMYKDKSRNDIRGYVTDFSFRYIAGYDSDNGSLQMLPIQNGRSGLAAEIHWWAQAMDSVPNP